MASNWLIPTITLVYFLLMVGQKVSTMHLLAQTPLNDGYPIRTGFKYRSRYFYEPDEPGRVIECEIRQHDDHDPKLGLMGLPVAISAVHDWSRELIVVIVLFMR